MCGRVLIRQQLLLVTPSYQRSSYHSHYEKWKWHKWHEKLGLAQTEMVDFLRLEWCNQRMCFWFNFYQREWKKQEATTPVSLDTGYLLPVNSIQQQDIQAYTLEAAFIKSLLKRINHTEHSLPLPVRFSVLSLHKASSECGSANSKATQTAHDHKLLTTTLT